MKTNPFFTAVVLTTAFLAPGAVAQTSTPTTPPAATATVASPMPAPNTIVYIPQLPTPAELANAAAAQGLSIDKIVQTSAQIIVVYEYANGQTSTVAYRLLPVAGSAPVAPATTTVAPAVAVAPAVTCAEVPTTVVYSPYYYDPGYDSTWPWWFVPFSFVGVGYYGGYGHGGGGYGHGGGYGGGYGHGGGGGHR
jgi:uncharacterized membrane protein YgcG